MSAEDAIAGALDIIAENVSDDADCRAGLRKLFCKIRRYFIACGKRGGLGIFNVLRIFGACFKIPGHRILAINRGEKEEFLKVSVEVSSDAALKNTYR